MTRTSKGSGHVWLSGLMLGLALSACARSSSPDQPAEHTSPRATAIRLELPPGILVEIDGVEHGETPLRDVAVAPGPHRLKLANACQVANATVEVAHAEVKTVDNAAVPELEYARLQLSIKNLAGEPLPSEITLGDWSPGESVSTAHLAVPSCKQRLTVEHPGLGKYLEDLEPRVGQAMTREVVLAPGPDMVRIAGGDFVLGPPERLADEYAECCGLARYPVHVRPFELDRTEVTAAQFWSCYEAGACKADSRAMTPDELDRMATTQLSPSEFDHLCTVKRIWNAHEARFEISEGRGDHPANCLALWQAAQYCSWAGKRLPTDVEWQYVARSGKSDYECPFGHLEPGRGTCGDEPSHMPKPTREACANPQRNSEDGICDLTDSLKEWVKEGVSVDRPSLGGRDCVAGEGETFRSPFCGYDAFQSVFVGFRCARTVGGVSDDEKN